MTSRCLLVNRLSRRGKRRLWGSTAAYGETVENPGGTMGQPGRGNRGFEMRWRVMLELTRAEGKRVLGALQVRLVRAPKWPVARSHGIKPATCASLSSDSRTELHT
jgi:hypothetical protein